MYSCSARPVPLRGDVLGPSDRQRDAGSLRSRTLAISTLPAPGRRRVPAGDLEPLAGAPAGVPVAAGIGRAGEADLVPHPQVGVERRAGIPGPQAPELAVLCRSTTANLAIDRKRKIGDLVSY